MSSDFDIYTSFIAGASIALACQFLWRKGFVGNTNPLKTAFTALQTGFKVKMVIAVRTDLPMGKGKLASQCAHASVLCYRNCQIKAPSILHVWELTGQPKVVVKANKSSEDCLLELKAKAENLGLISCVVRDAGRTQLEPGCLTVVGIGPGPSTLVDEVTKHLKLL